MRFAICVVLVLCSLVGHASTAAAQQPPQRGIVNVTGQLYRAQNDNHYTVFLVTPQGIIMSDPINRDFSRWLKGEIASRFKVPVRYVLYTHRDWDHASGGVVWADTAEFVGHRNMLAALAPPAGNPPLPADAVKLDANRNGLVERAEASGGYADRFALYDYNRDEVLSGAEIARGSVSDVHPPTTTYLDRHTVTLGGKRVTMTHLGTAHADDSSVLHFPDERAVFSADVLQVKRLPGGLAPTVGAWIDPQPMRIHDTEPFFNWAVPQLGDFSIEPGTPYVSRYRFLVADGPAAAGVLELQQKAFAGGAAATLAR